jgi:hypothetical protein
MKIDMRQLRYCYNCILALFFHMRFIVLNVYLPFTIEIHIKIIKNAQRLRDT